MSESKKDKSKQPLWELIINIILELFSAIIRFSKHLIP
ncbi:hypothetical protein CO98_1260 [Staphylococcus aureus subsp. aureus CO-98]|jgi:hypothetical protein|uniref:Uncharacterized protein n=1 Tax=Staphylococcus haemolyticus (strain JCSC1435) TaxID=279808 RepID=Q4L9Q2_STAHJ|nr:hypothetical protein CO98_1260 [Staphylococcus aureus subsp. aureus CO-98]BAE03623.1 unnamed protein product [Staphylococcus haemolyticus JCSC1435]